MEALLSFGSSKVAFHRSRGKELREMYARLDLLGLYMDKRLTESSFADLSNTAAFNK